VSKKNDLIFAERLAAAEDELKWLYCELYGTDETAFRYFCDMLRQSFKQRRQSLRTLDQQRLNKFPLRRNFIGTDHKKI